MRRQAGRRLRGGDPGASSRSAATAHLRTISVRPEYSKENGRALIGFSYGTEPVSFSAGAAVGHAWDSMWMVASGTVHVFAHIFEAKQRKQISGIVGISDVAHQAIDTGATQALLLLALVSLSLGLINLLPILPLDGGHIFWSLVEKLRGEPVSLRVMERASIDRLRPGGDALLHRPQQRHRPPHRRRLQRPLARVRLREHLEGEGGRARGRRSPVAAGADLEGVAAERRAAAS